MIRFEIIETEGIIMVFSTTEKFTEFSIEISDLWEFVLSKGYNQYCIDYFNPQTSSHEQKTGELSYDDYFGLNNDDILPDIEEYLQKNRLI